MDVRGGGRHHKLPKTRNCCQNNPALNVKKLSLIGRPYMNARKTKDKLKHHLQKINT